MGWKTCFTGGLFSSEGPADFGSGRGDVDVHDAAVRSLRPDPLEQARNSIIYGATKIGEKTGSIAEITTNSKNYKIKILKVYII
jgi:hypothetical protein